MANVTFKAKRQIQTDLLTQIIAELGLNDVNPGSVIDILTNAVAQEDFAQYVQMAQILRLTDLDAITGDDLDNKAFEFGIERLSAKKATGKIDILRPAGFVKVSSTFYAGSPAPIQGNTIIDVNDASSALIGTSGTLIIGRGTPNEEEVSYSTAPVNNTNFYRFTLDVGVANNHAIEESVILKQGNDESIIAGTQIKVPATGASAEIVFVTNNDVTLLAGEDRFTDAEVTAVTAGSKGNVPIKAIEGANAFASEPFAGARAENVSKFTTGRDREQDDQLRDRIREHVQSISKGVKEAILNAIVGLVDEESAKRVVSANVILPIDECGPVKVYIDDGTGFEPSFASRGFEEVLRISSGGEQRLQLDRQPQVKAQVENNIEEPYNMSGGLKTLIYNVGTQSETVTFAPSDFEFPESARAEEIVRALNDKAILIEARTSQVGKRVTITAKSDTNESLQVTGGTALSILGFPTDKKETLYLYVDDQLVSKDGATALINSGNQSPFNFAAIGAFPHTLTLVVDGKIANPQTITFQSADFSDTNAITALELVTVINSQLVGCVAQLADNGSKVRIVSNTKLSSGSKIQITGGTANDVTNGLNFSTSEVSGSDGDYVFNKELGIIEFIDPLPANVGVTSGSQFTRAKLRATLAENYAPSDTTTLVIIVDGVSQTITFDATLVGGFSAQDTANFINAQLLGATASAREIGTDTFLELNTNTYDGGTIELDSASTANGVFGFPEDVEAQSQDAHKSFQVSANAGPYDFRENDSIVAILDNDITNNTFSVIMSYAGDITGSTSSTIFAISAFTNVFDVVDSLKDYKVAFTSGNNTVTGDVESVTDQTGGIFRLAFSALPASLANIAAEDLIKVETLQNNANNGFFIVDAISVVGNGYVDVRNVNGIAESGSSGTALMSQMRIVDSYDESNGTITAAVAFSSAPSVSDTLVVIPRTTQNTVEYMSNTRISSLSTKSIISGVENNTKVQIESLQEGSDGYVQITGGKANDELGFSTDVYRGLQGYQYYTGLLKLVHRTIYGDDTDLVSYPGVGAAGIKFIILAPTVNEISVNANVTLSEGISIASVENEIKSAITGYVNNLGIGKDVIVEEIRCRIQQISGVTDVVLNSPTINIAIADNELARTRESLILIG
tara:strand:+ start:38411 stop:41830 length:3420 start_codon:yes stop_codon:yes gene_type:complete